MRAGRARVQAIGNPQMARELARRGLNKSQIAAVLDIAPPTIHLYLSEEYRRSRVDGGYVRSDAGTTSSRCRLCGRASAHESSRCGFCAPAHRTGMREGRAEERVRILLRWAEQNEGRIPKLPEAMQILMVNRSCAGDALLNAFGRDPRNGATRHKTRRKLRVS